jgi:hypothetical protein
MTRLGPYHNYTVRDFAGGLTIHTSTGVAGFIVSLFMQSNKESPTLGHHNLPLNIIGGVIVWGMHWMPFVIVVIVVVIVVFVVVVVVPVVPVVVVVVLVVFILIIFLIPFSSSS